MVMGSSCKVLMKSRCVTGESFCCPQVPHQSLLMGDVVLVLDARLGPFGDDSLGDNAPIATSVCILLLNYTFY